MQAAAPDDVQNETLVSTGVLSQIVDKKNGRAFVRGHRS